MNAPKTEKTGKDKPTGNEDRAACEKDRPLPSVDAVIQGVIGRRLRDSYDEIVREQVPKELLDLLEVLKQKEKEESAKGGSG